MRSDILTGMPRRSSASREAHLQGLTRIAEAMSMHFGVAITEVRYATYEFHNGSHWTISYGWERRVDGIWQAEKWLPPTPGTPAKQDTVTKRSSQLREVFRIGGHDS
jgi:hypothetical protein